MNIRLQQLNPTIGDIDGNMNLMLSALREAEQADVDLLMLPELAVCGYSPMDLLERPAFRETIFRANKQIVQASGDTAILFGTITKNDKQYGRPCYNSAILAQHGSTIAEVHKCLLPTYDVFDEDRYFERGESPQCVEWNGCRLGITICEDIWANNSAVQYHTYAQQPVQQLVDDGAKAIFNLSGSPFGVTKSEDRLQMLQKNAQNRQRPIFYVNQVGASTELISDGDSMVLNSEGEIISRAPLFKTAFIDVEWDKDNEPEANKANPVAELPSKNERIFKALCCGLDDYFEKTGITRQVVLGLSGGIDSSLVACIAVEALGAENVMGVSMPSEFSSEGSISDAQKLADNLGMEMHEMLIKSLYNEYTAALEPLFEGTDFGVAEENLQSRARGVLLMAIANKFNRFVLNTGNKSELATGYCTLYGDMNGALAVISDLYKTEVFALSQWLNESYYGKEIIPQTVLDKPPSAELRPDQKDSDSLPEYDTLDNILKLYIEEQCSVAEIQGHGFEQSTVRQIIRLVDASQHKRYQAPPGLKIHDKAFGSGRRWPLVQHWVKNTLG